MEESILFACPGCGHQMKLPATTVGRRGACPACKQMVTIQLPLAPSPPLDPPPNSPPRKMPPPPPPPRQSPVAASPAPSPAAPAVVVPQAMEAAAAPSPPAALPDTPQVSDSLGDDRTYTGEHETPPRFERSLGDQATAGDALSSLSDESDLADGLVDEMPLVDLSERYEIQEPLGKGGMGEVFLALDKRLKRSVAIKRVQGEMARSTKALSRFLTEAQSIAQLDHENIIDIYDYGRAQDGPFLIMQYIGGGSLLDRCREGPLPLEEAIDLTCQLCDALQMAHSRGIIHRDIKPANILLTEEGVPKLTDFGLARQQSVDHGQTQAGAVLGTIDFMPPEQRLDATATDGRSDLWSLAATLYQMITGKSPKIIKFNNVPQSLQDVMSKALEDAPTDRYQTAREFRDALRASLQVQQSLPVATPVSVPPARPHPVGGEPARRPTQQADRTDRGPVRKGRMLDKYLSQSTGEHYVPRKSKFIAVLLAFPLTGVFGAHNSYLGETKLAKRQLIITCTVIGLYVTIVWALIDLVKIAIGSKRDVFGRKLV